MSKSYILGVDQSTQGTKAVIFDDEGRLLERSDISHEQIISKEGWVSHDASCIMRNVYAACKDVIEKSGIEKNAIACMGITNQRETSVAWDKKTGEPIGHAIVWQCNRAKDICSEIEAKYGCADEIYQKTGLKLSPYYPAGKWAWILNNNKVPDADNVALGTVDCWLIYNLTKDHAFKSDFSNASRTQLFNLHTMTWDEDICKYFGINLSSLPEICDSDSVFGYTDLDGFLPDAIPICGVLGDSHGALFGHNCRKKGQIKATYGTGSSIMMNIGDTPLISDHGLSTSVGWKINGEMTYVLEGNINYTGAVITWLKDSLGFLNSPKEAEGMAKAANPEDESYIVPAFSGLGAPWWNNDAKAIIVGMNRTTGKNELVKAGCECINYQINDIIEAMRTDSGVDVSLLCVDGGPTRNAYIMQFQSDISNVDVNVPNTEELSVIGASYLAGLSKGIYKEASLYDAISYSHYSPKMDKGIRDKNIAGWKKAINMVNR